MVIEDVEMSDNAECSIIRNAVDLICIYLYIDQVVLKVAVVCIVYAWE